MEQVEILEFLTPGICGVPESEIGFLWMESRMTQWNVSYIVNSSQAVKGNNLLSTLVSS